jgi:hypothetical protein
MLKKTINYTDFDGNPQQEDWYFHLSKAELVEFNYELGGMDEGGLEKRIKEIVTSNNAKLILSTFKDLIKRTVGKRSVDGKRFLKTQDIVDDFMTTEAYSALFMELVTNAEAAAAFIRGLVPSDMADKIDMNALNTAQVSSVTETVDDRPAWVRENREPTKAELLKMPQEQLVELMRQKATQ